MQGLNLTSTMAAAGPMGGFYSLLAGGVLLLALGVAVKALFHDRAKGRSRCRLCAYPLPHDKLDPCPECGWKPRKQKDLYRTRRSKRWGFVALLLVVLAGLTWYWPHVQYRRTVLNEPLIRAMVPTTYLIWAVPHTDQNEWMKLCQRVSGNQIPHSLFAQNPQDLPGSGTPLAFEPDPIHLGYKTYEYKRNTYEGVIFTTGPPVTETIIYHWQGQYFLDRLMATAKDEDQSLAKRVDAFYLYTDYSGYERLEHFEQVLPLLLGENSEAFRDANASRPYWGMDRLDPNPVAEELSELCFDTSKALIYQLSVFEGLALTGQPAIETIEKLWASDNDILQERGDELMTAFVDAVHDARGKNTGLDRSQLDVDRIIRLIDQAYGRDESGREVILDEGWVDSFCSVLPYVEHGVFDELRNTTRREVPVEPDAFFYAFNKALIAWVAKQSNEEDADVETLTELLDSCLYSGGLDLDFKQSEPLMDSFEQLLDASHNDIRMYTIKIYGSHVYDATSDPEHPIYSEQDLNSLRSRLQAMVRREDVGKEIQAEVSYLIEELDDHGNRVK